MTGSFDISLLQMLNGSTSSFLDALMITLTSGYTWIALYAALLYLIVSNSENMAKIVLAVGCALLCVVLSGGVCDFIIKPLVARPRPINDPQLHDIIRHVGGMWSKDFSFFSSHAANTVSLTVFFALLVRNRALTIALSIWALTNCYTRLYLGMHFPSDVLTGMLWGAVMGCVSYCIYRRIYSRNLSMMEFVSTQYTSKGYTISTIDVVITTLILIYIYAVVRAFIVA